MSSSASLNSPQSPKRPSRFIEGSPLTKPDLQRRPTALNNILAEMDVYEEKQRKHRCSTSSVDSLEPSSPSPITSKSDKRKGSATGCASMGDIDQVEIRGEATLKVKVKGRLRALSGGFYPAP